MDRNICLVILWINLTALAFGFLADEVLEEEWKSFKLEYKKTYGHELEEQKRMQIFLENKAKIAQHNQKYYRGGVSYRLALNQFGDLTQDEFVATLNGYKGSVFEPNITRKDTLHFTRQQTALPKFVDWRTKQAVTPIKDQGQCGSCWAFSAVGSLEGAHKIKTGVLVSLSEQNLMDCSKRYGNNACNGGSMENAFRYIRDNGGIDTEKSYPYLGIDSSCHFNPRTVGATVRGFVSIPRGNEAVLQEAVATKGPVSVAIDASQFSFQFYLDGVYNEPNCSTVKLNHGVVAIGYGTEENGKEYWLVKNSWGLFWGDLGYIKMSRNLHNQCGIATQAIYPIV